MRDFVSKDEFEDVLLRFSFLSREFFLKFNWLDFGFTGLQFLISRIIESISENSSFSSRVKHCSITFLNEDSFFDDGGRGQLICGVLFYCSSNLIGGNSRIMSRIISFPLFECLNLFVQSTVFSSQ